MDNNNFPRTVSFKMNNKRYSIERNADNSIIVYENNVKIPDRTTLPFLKTIINYFKFKIEPPTHRKTDFYTRQLGRYIMKAIEGQIE